MRGPRDERGAALVVVMVMVLLAALLMSGALRTAWLNEMAAGFELDYLQAFDNAQALLRDAEFDIKGTAPDGGSCQALAANAGSCRAAAGAALSNGKPGFPRQGSGEFDKVHALLAARTPSCAQGICVVDGVAPEFWRLPRAELDKMKAVAAHFGEFSGAAPMQDANPLLTTKGWYWVEILPFDPGAPVPAGAEALAPDADSPYVYRVTAISEGRKPGSRAVLQSLLVLKKAGP